MRILSYSFISIDLKLCFLSHGLQICMRFLHYRQFIVSLFLSRFRLLNLASFMILRHRVGGIVFYKHISSFSLSLQVSVGMDIYLLYASYIRYLKTCCLDDLLSKKQIGLIVL